MLSAKSTEFFVRHRIRREGCGQKNVVNCQRHGFSVSQKGGYITPVIPLRKHQDFLFLNPFADAVRNSLCE